jgi:hypothetical protein
MTVVIDRAPLHTSAYPVIILDEHQDANPTKPASSARVQLPARLIAGTCPQGSRVPGHLFIPRSQLGNESPWALWRCPCGRRRVLQRQPKDMPGTALRATGAGLDAARRTAEPIEIATPASSPCSHCGPSVADANTTSVLRDGRLIRQRRCGSASPATASDTIILRPDARQ